MLQDTPGFTGCPPVSFAHADGEHDLLTLIASGNQGAFRTLVQQYAPLLIGYATHILESKSAAEDVVQDVFFRMWDQRNTIVQHIPLRAYLLAVVRNASLDILRRQAGDARREAAYVQEETPPGMGMPAQNASDAVIRHELAHALQHAIQHLPPRQRQIVFLRLQQLSYAEIAQVLGIAPKTVEAHIFQAFTALRRTLHLWSS